MATTTFVYNVLTKFWLKYTYKYRFALSRIILTRVLDKNNKNLFGQLSYKKV